MGQKARRKVKNLLHRRKAALDDAERLIHWYKALPVLEDIASNARTRAYHYQGFHVGVSALMRDANGKLVTAGGANHKKAPGPRQEGDHCGEDDIFVASKDLECEEILGMVVVAPPKIDDFSDFDLGVTISCGHCRNRFRREIASGGALRPGTRLLFVNADNPRKRAEMPVETVLELCRKRDERRNGENGS